MINIGMLWAVASGIGFGFFSLVNRRSMHYLDVYVGTFILFSTTAVILAILSLLTAEAVFWSQLSLPAIFYFAVAGLLHFFLGWTLFSVSQKRIGAARTSVIMSTMPLFATLLGWLFLAEVLNGAAWLGIGLIVLGVYIVGIAKVDPTQATISGDWRLYLYATGTALCFATSPVFTRWGLALIPAPTVGVAVGMSVCVLATGLVLLLRRSESKGNGWSVPANVLWWQIAAGVIIALATWGRWVALDLVQIAPVVALSRMSVPVVLLLAPFVIGQQHEQVTVRVWLGGICILMGSFVLTFYG